MMESFDTLRDEWFGHMHRLSESALAKQAIHEATAKKAKKVSGDQGTTWISTIEKDLKHIDKTTTKAAELVINKETYAQNMVNGAMERSLAKKR